MTELSDDAKHVMRRCISVNRSVGHDCFRPIDNRENEAFNLLADKGWVEPLQDYWKLTVAGREVTLRELR